MSGGAFDYRQRSILDIAESIEQTLSRAGKEKTKDEIYAEYGYWEKSPRYPFNIDYSDEVKQEMKKAVDVLKTAYIYAQRVDYLISGDDSEGSFLKRLKEDL